VHVHRFAYTGGAEATLARDVAVVPAGAGTAVDLTIARSDPANSYYGYEVVAVNAKGSSPTARARVVMPNVVGLCSWSMWQTLRGVGLPPHEAQSGVDPSGRDDSQVYAQTLAVGSTVQSGTVAEIKSYCPKAGCS